MTVRAHDVASELRRRLPGLGAVKLHKLLYYCQGWHLAWTGEPMFRESIEAWDVGPVVADLWHDEDKGRRASAPVPVDDSARATINYVVARYGQLTGRDLVHLTHAEAPWRDASENGQPNPVISSEAMTSHFASDDEAGPVMRLADAALGDPETGRFLREAVERSRLATTEPDDPAEIQRRLQHLQP